MRSPPPPSEKQNKQSLCHQPISHAATELDAAKAWMADRGFGAGAGAGEPSTEGGNEAGTAADGDGAVDLARDSARDLEGGLDGDGPPPKRPRVQRHRQPDDRPTSLAVRTAAAAVLLPIAPGDLFEDEW